MAVKMTMKKRSRSKPNFAERDLGIQGRGMELARIADFFSNPAARTGFGTTSLENGTQYNIERWSLNYWAVMSMFEVSWVARRIVEAPAQDIVKTWPAILGDTDPEDTAKIDRIIRKTNTKNQILEGLINGRLFGGAGALIVIKGHEKKLDEPLDLDEVELNSYKGLTVFDRWSGITPSSEVCSDIDRPLDFGLPEFYECHGKDGASFRVHSSRIIRFTGPMMPEPERSAYSGWGMSVLAPVMQSIVSYDNVSYNALSLSYRAQIVGMRMPDLASLLSGLGGPQGANQAFAQRMCAVNEMLSNQSLVLLPKDGELSKIDYSFSGLYELIQAFQLQLAGAAKMPVSLLWGRTLNGLGQAGDGDERIYEKTVATEGNTSLRPALEKLYPVIMVSELGEVPDDMDLDFPSIRVLTEQEKAELAKNTVDAVTVCINTGIMTPRQGGTEVKKSAATTGFGGSITDEALEKLKDEVQAEGELGEGLFGEEGGKTLDPAGSPTAALKETDKLAAGKGAAQDDVDDDGLMRDPDDVAPVEARRAADVRMTPELVWLEACDNEADTIPKAIRGTEEGQRQVRANALRNLSFYAEQFKVPYEKCLAYVKGRGLAWDVAKVHDADSITLVLVPSETKVQLELHKAGCNHVPASVLRRNKPFTVSDVNAALSAERAANKGTPVILASCAKNAVAHDADGPSRGALTVHGLPLVIETRKGEERHGHPLPYHYGYIKGVNGADGDSMDFALGPEPESNWAYVFDQRKLPPAKGFDEHKCFLGYGSMDAAQRAFAAGHDRAHLVYMDVTPMQIDELKTWLKSGDHSKPVGGVSK